MVTVLRAAGLRVVIFVDDHQPAHVHVFGDGHAKINLLGADGTPELVWVDGMTRGEIRRQPDDDLVLLDRQALHAWRIRFLHPGTQHPLEVEAPLPADIAGVLQALRTYRTIAR